MGVATLISSDTDFRGKKITIDKEGNYTVIKGSIHQEGTIIPNLGTDNKISNTRNKNR